MTDEVSDVLAAIRNGTTSEFAAAHARTADQLRAQFIAEFGDDNMPEIDALVQRALAAQPKGI